MCRSYSKRKVRKFLSADGQSALGEVIDTKLKQAVLIPPDGVLPFRRRTPSCDLALGRGQCQPRFPSLFKTMSAEDICRRIDLDLETCLPGRATSDGVGKDLPRPTFSDEARSEPAHRNERLQRASPYAACPLVSDGPTLNERRGRCRIATRSYDLRATGTRQCSGG